MFKISLLSVLVLTSSISYAQDSTVSDAPKVTATNPILTQIKASLCTDEVKYNKEKEAVGRVLIAKDAEIKKLQDNAGVPVWVVVISVGVGVLVGATVGGVVGSEIQKGKGK